MEVEEGFEVCRVCLTSREATPLFSIFLLNGYDAGMMRDLAGIDVSQDEGVYDGLICSECAVELQEVHNFMAAMREAETNYFGPKREEVYGKECQKDENKSEDKVKKVGNNSKEGSVKQKKVRVNVQVKKNPKRNIRRSVKFNPRKKENRPFKCSICSHSFIYKNFLRYHLEAIHARNKRFECDLCAKQFYYLHEVKSHMKWHKNPKYNPLDSSRPHKCTHRGCNKYFNTKNHLESHVITHANYPINNPSDSSRPYKCTHRGCKKYFKRKQNLEHHMITHVDHRPFACCCKKAFKFKGQLKTHQINIHGKISKNLR
ncbi:CLUMA_CG001502, isoform A [Clunio marinus]|uniref:CLUMA_CG001502, isoform A n=1 Tax=Clunio marinus TaxID=568069 RepID=A0A1J1HI44_9DIPT|nr:CLUMA_CG001502, isoform A [Clunio marinus]